MTSTRFSPPDRLHVHDAAIHHQVAPLHQLDAHLPRQKAVFEVGAVVNSRREQHDLRVVFSARRKAAQDSPQLRGIMVDGQYLAGVKDFREDSRHHQPVFQNIGDAAGRAHVIFQNVVLARFGVANQIDPANVRENPSRNLHIHHLAKKMRAGVNQRPRKLAVLQDALLAVDVLQEKIQRHDALRQAAVDSLPFRIRNNAGNQVEGKEPLGASAVAVDRKGDALDQEGKVGQLAPFLELLAGHGGEFLEYIDIRRPRLAARTEHLVVEIPRIIAGEQPGKGSANGCGLHRVELLYQPRGMRLHAKFLCGPSAIYAAIRAAIH